MSSPKLLKGYRKDKFGDRKGIVKDIMSVRRESVRYSQVAFSTIKTCFKKNRAIIGPELNFKNKQKRICKNLEWVAQK
ncbi:hypothetical protein GCM10022210_20870 [Mucilaginibacter dorajii]|uniref:Transposase n=1 Tax=Mucilaginibacter dorajii TaxID=692994 RepID=A0ABP7PUA4_9SPHI